MNMPAHTVNHHAPITMIVGIGVTGLSCARYLHKNKIPFCAIDHSSHPHYREDFQREFPDVPLTLGAEIGDIPPRVERVLLSPGVVPPAEWLDKVTAASIPIINDIELFVGVATAPIVAITGTNGKSTVTSLVAKMACADGMDAVGCGNIGVPVLDQLSDTCQLYVVELSSFQLERVEQLNAQVATVLNMSDDHLERHKDMQSYHRVKHRIFRGCRNVVINRSDKLTVPLISNKVHRWSFGLDAPLNANDFGVARHKGEQWLMHWHTPLLPTRSLSLIGHYNWENILAAFALGQAIGINRTAMCQVARDFKGLPHRCQWVGERNGVQFYNDSKGTNVAAACRVISDVARQHHRKGRLIWIGGGIGKSEDFTPLVTALSQCVHFAVVLGQSAPHIIEQLQNQVASASVHSMEEAVDCARQKAQEGDIVLLSPACSSFDMFENFAHRGEAFIRAVKNQ